MSTGLLDEATFRTVVDSTPLVSIDLIVRRGDGCILLGRRKNRPASGFLFVPGGRVRKGETLDSAFRRLTRSELGEELGRGQARLLGVYEHLYEDSVFGSDSGVSGTHYVVLGYEVSMPEVADDDLPLEQHSDYCWMEPFAMRSSVEVHDYTKAYLTALQETNSDRLLNSM